MFDSPTPNHANLDLGLACRRPADLYWHLVRTLRLTLPPPGPDPTSEDLLCRDHAAIARITALAPANAAEADVAAQFVAASEQWKDCLRLAQEPDTTSAWAAKCRAQATGMMRQANSALGLLLRMQAARRKLEADEDACDRAVWTEHTVTRQMAEALAHIAADPNPLAAPSANAAQGSQIAEAAVSPSPCGTEPGGRVAHVSVEAKNGTPAAEPTPDLAAAAERYAAIYPERAALIRRTGRLPCDVVYFDPPEAALARALMAGVTPAPAGPDRAIPGTRTT